MLCRNWNIFINSKNFLWVKAEWTHLVLLNGNFADFVGTERHPHLDVTLMLHFAFLVQRKPHDETSSRHRLFKWIAMNRKGIFLNAAHYSPSVRSCIGQSAHCHVCLSTPWRQFLSSVSRNPWHLSHPLFLTFSRQRFRLDRNPTLQQSNFPRWEAFPMDCGRHTRRCKLKYSISKGKLIQKRLLTARSALPTWGTESSIWLRCCSDAKAPNWHTWWQMGRTNHWDLWIRAPLLRSLRHSIAFPGAVSCQQRRVFLRGAHLESAKSNWCQYWFDGIEGFVLFTLNASWM